MIEMSSEMLMGIILGIVVPLLLWGMRMYWMVRTNLKMHQEPDTHGFGSGQTNMLLTDMCKDQTAIHRENMASAKNTRYTIRELTHYVKWETQQRTGQAPPPYVRNGD